MLPRFEHGDYVMIRRTGIPARIIRHLGGDFYALELHEKWAQALASNARWQHLRKLSDLEVLAYEKEMP